MRRILVMAVSMVAVLSACGSGDGTGPSISATLPPGASVPVSQPAPVETDAAPPPETQPPATQPPATQPPETQAPDEPAASTAPTDTVAPDTEGDDGTVWWPWVLAAIIIVGGAIALLGRRRSGPTWQARAIALLDQIDQLTSHLAALPPDAVQVVAAGDASNLATMRGTLRDLVASAPGADQRAALDTLTVPLGQLHGAVDAVALSGASAQPGVSTVAQFAAYVHTTSASVRADAAMYH